MTRRRPRATRLPKNPTPAQLQRILKSAPINAVVRGPVAPHSGPGRASLSNMEAFLCLSEVFEKATDTTPAILLDRIRSVDRRTAIVRLATFAAALANDGPTSPFVRHRTIGALAGILSPLKREESILRDYLNSAPPSRPLAHEAVLYFLQALFILEGRDLDEGAPDSLLAYMMLLANDHVIQWRTHGNVTERGGQLADFALVTRFNHNEDPLRSFLRGALMVQSPPPRGPLADESSFTVLQRTAFGMSTRDYIEQFAGPLFIETVRWGQPENESVHIPIIQPSRWASETSVPQAEVESFLSTITVSLDAARAILERDRRPDGLIHAPSLFYRTPLLSLADDTIVGVSPWVVREQIRLGVWGRLMEAAKGLYPKKGAEVWLSAFGDLFETWCRRVAVYAAASEHFCGQLVLAPEVGHADEIEDVVILDKGTVVLFSVKTRLMREADVRQAGSAEAVVAWYESFLFAPPRGNQRGGALRLLNKKVEAIRQGEVSRVDPGARIFPVLVTFEDLGDSPVLNRWSQERCMAEGLLRQRGVAWPAFANIDSFESLMALAAGGVSLAEVLAERSNVEGGLAALDVFIARASGRAGIDRLPQLKAEFDRVMNDITVRLFGKGRSDL